MAKNADWIHFDFSDDDIELIEEKPISSQGRKRRIAPVCSGKNHLESKYDLNSSELWLNKYKPTSCAQIAGNKAKISQLKDWVSSLQKKFYQGQQNILLVTGPSGCGKTAAIEAIATDLGICIRQWNSQSSDYVPLEEVGDNSIQYQSQRALFESFLIRATKYRTLPLLSDTVEGRSTTGQLVLVEDMPNIYTRNPAEWHNLLRAYSKTSRNLIVIIFNTSGPVTERALFPESLQTELNIKHVAFNTVPKTDIKRLLNYISDNEKHLEIPQDFITSLSESCDGDVRTAVNSLQFTFSAPKTFQPAKSGIKSSSRSRKSSKSAAGKKKALRSTLSGSTVDEDLHRSDHQKDPTLIIFRALGKVLYCKRVENQSESEQRLPAHLRHHVRRNMAFNPEEVFEQSKVSADYYSLCLHQNFPQFALNLENVRRATDYLSHSDCLSDRYGSRYVTGQATVGVSVAARGLMHSNTSTSTKHSWLPLRKPYWFAARKLLAENQTNVKWQNSTVYSSTALATDLVPVLHMMKASTVLADVIPPFPSSLHYKPSNHDRLDENYGRDDISLDIVYESEAHPVLEGADQEEAIPAYKDNPEEFFIESVD